MPPKKKVNEGPSKKAVQKQKEKIIEDKTFGIKNKKGKKQQQYVKNVTQQVKSGGTPSARKLQQEQDAKNLLKETKKKDLGELNQLFKPVAQKVSAGVDPKSVLCAFFKQGSCTKGDKCKFSHDLSLERKGEKKSIYVDSRDEDLKNDTMDTWDQNKLEEVVEQKHGAKEKQKQKTDIVCKYFLEAIDKSLYGWFWVCPNGGDKCIYKHCLPPGFVLKKKQEKDQTEEISIEEFVEDQRAKLGTNLTKVTLETFLEWKKRKLKEKKETYEKEQSKKKEDYKAGRIVGKVSGREVFTFRPELIEADIDDDELTEDMTMYRRKDQEEELRELSIEALSAAAREADSSGTVVAAESVSERLKRNAETSACIPGASQDGHKQPQDTSTTDANGLDEACGGGVEPSGDQAAMVDGVPIDENLFENMEDLDMEDLDIVD